MADERKMIISIETQNGDGDDFKIKPHTLMGTVIARWCELKNVEKTRLRFLHNGQPIMDNDTAESVRSIGSPSFPRGDTDFLAGDGRA
jgi:hypothetical protein